MIRYFRATDGVFTVFRHSNSTKLSFRSASMRLGGDGVAEIGFRDKGQYPAVKIDKAEYDALVHAKMIRRSRVEGRISSCDGEPSQSWVRNVDL
jgi:hypothetical protein